MSRAVRVLPLVASRVLPLVASRVLPLVASRVLPLVALALVAFAAADAHACAVCFSTTDQNRWAFIGTTVFMSVLPLAILLGVGVWLRHKVVEMERRADAARATTPPRPEVGRAATLPHA